jgi:hypothetical protein
MRDVTSKRIQADEIWSFCYAKQKNVTTGKAAPHTSCTMSASILPNSAISQTT